MIDIIMELLLVWVMGCGMLIAAFVVGDVTGEWLPRVLRSLHQRYIAAKVRMGWWNVAARHKRRVRA